MMEREIPARLGKPYQELKDALAMHIYDATGLCFYRDSLLEMAAVSVALSALTGKPMTGLPALIAVELEQLYSALLATAVRGPGAGALRSCLDANAKAWRQWLQREGLHLLVRERSERKPARRRVNTSPQDSGLRSACLVVT